MLCTACIKLQNPKVFNYLQKCLDNMLTQNQGDAKGVENGFEAFWGPLFLPIHMVPSY